MRKVINNARDLIIILVLILTIRIFPDTVVASAKGYMNPVTFNIDDLESNYRDGCFYIDISDLKNGVYNIKTSINVTSAWNDVEHKEVMPEKVFLYYLDEQKDDEWILLTEINEPQKEEIFKWDFSTFNSGLYQVKIIGHYKYPNEMTNEYENIMRCNFYRPIYFEHSGALVLDSGKPDTLLVSVPQSVNPDRFGGVELLTNGDSLTNEVCKPVLDPPFEISEDSLKRTYKFLWYGMEGNNWISLCARYKNDPLSNTEKSFRIVEMRTLEVYSTTNLPPTIDKINSREVLQHYPYGRVILTGITNGENDVQYPSLKQKVKSIEFSSSNDKLLPVDSIKIEYTQGDSTAIMYFVLEGTLNGEAIITVKVTDDGGTEFGGKDTKEIKFKIKVLPFNAPVYKTDMKFLSELTEDFGELTIDLNDYFTDPEGDSIKYNVGSSYYDEDIIETSLKNNILKVKSKKDKFGRSEIELSVTDNIAEGYWLRIPVIVENDSTDIRFNYSKRRFRAATDSIFVINMETSLSERINLSGLYSSESLKPASYEVSLNRNDIVKIELKDSVLIIEAIKGKKGLTTADVKIEIDGRSYSTKLNIAVGNHSPEIIKKIPDITAEKNFEDISFKLNEYFHDPNGDWVSYSVKTKRDKVNTVIYDEMYIGTESLYIQSVKNVTGTDSLFIEVTDGTNTITDSIEITIKKKKDK